MSDQPKGAMFGMFTLIKDDVRPLAHMPRILALDGGGVRGLSSLLILERLMQEVQRCWKCLIRGVLLRLGGTLGENGENIPVGYV